VVDRIRILSEVADDDMADLYRLADVVVSIPGSDGGASTVTEALACGRPLVATDLPSVREWLSGLDPHALVPVGDATATAQALERALARSSVDRDELARRSRAAVEQMGDEQKALDDMERIHVELVGRSGPPTVERR
jgi:glycosyltransferase involved in cell wall biosynthesis